MFIKNKLICQEIVPAVCQCFNVDALPPVWLEYENYIMYNTIVI